MALSRKPIEIVEDGKHQLLTKAPHWDRVALSLVADVQNGFAFESEFFSNSEGKPLIRIRDIGNESTQSFYTEKYSEEYVVRRGDILIGMDGDFNSAEWKGNDGLLNQRVCRLLLHSQLYNRKFLFFCLQPFLDAINAETSSVTVKHLSSKTISEIPLPLPPLAEQQRIVAKLEELCSELDKGVENLRTAQQQLKVYRQALLKHAFEGKLTAEWRAQNPDKLESAEALLVRIQQEREARYQQQLAEWKDAQKVWEAAGKTGSKPAKPRALITLPPLTAKELAELPELPEGWAWFHVSHLLAEELCNGKSVKDRSGGFPVLRLNALANGKIDLSITKPGDWDEDEARQYLVQEGDFLVSRGNGSKHLVGRGGFASYKSMNHDHVAFPDTMIRIRLLSQNICQHYFGFCWDSLLLRSQIEKSSRTTAGIYKINQELIAGFVLPLPCREEQEFIEIMLSEKLSNLDQLENTIANSLQQAEALRQSILKKAFSGQLVPQHPDDELASVLLERIRAERAAQQPTTKRGRKVAKPA